jgi:hypothetical protein
VLRQAHGHRQVKLDKSERGVYNSPMETKNRTMTEHDRVEQNALDALRRGLLALGAVRHWVPSDVLPDVNSVLQLMHYSYQDATMKAPGTGSGWSEESARRDLKLAVESDTERVGILVGTDEARETSPR